MSVTRPLVLAACLAVLGTLSTTAGAQNAARGQGLYSTFPYGCSDCHAPDPRNDKQKTKPSGGVKSGTVWQNIAFGINSPVDGNNEMTMQLKSFYDQNQITDNDLQDISAYLQGVFGGTPPPPPPPTGSVSAPGSASFGSVTV